MRDAQPHDEPPPHIDADDAEFGDDVFRAVVEASVSPFVLLDTAGTVRWVGPRVAELLGAPPPYYLGRSFLEMIHPSGHEVALSAFSEFVVDDDVRPWIGPPMVLDLVRVDGNVVACEVSASMGAPHGIDGVIIQVRRSRATPLLYDAIDALALGAPVHDVLARLALLCEHDTPGSSVAVAWDWDGDRFRHSVPAVSRGGPLSLQHDGPAPWRDAMASDSVQGGGLLRDGYPALAEIVEPAGHSACWVIPITVRGDRSPSAALVLWREEPGGAHPHRTTTAQRIARLVAFALESHRKASKLRTEATTDELTGLDNRLAQRRALADLLTRAEGSASAAVLFCDLDGFKPVNDVHGHEFGDRVLTIVAHRMQDATRATEHLARWGGDEFVITCGVGDADEVTALAERLIDTVSAPIALDGVEVRVGLSIGIAYADRLTDADVLLRAADDALREAKDGGKGRWVAHRAEVLPVS